MVAHWCLYVISFHGHCWQIKSRVMTAAHVTSTSERKEKPNLSVKRSLRRTQVLLGRMTIQYEQHQQSCALCFCSCNMLLALQETAASYGLGAVGSLVYLRMLNRSIDSVGGVGAALSQPRLLVPVILTGTFNRYDVGFSHQSTQPVLTQSAHWCCMPSTALAFCGWVFSTSGRSPWRYLRAYFEQFLYRV